MGSVTDRPFDWNKVPVLPTEPSAADVPHGGEPVFIVDGIPHAELPEVGFGALVGWAAGTSRLLRHPDHRDRHTTRVSEISPAGRRISTHLRTLAEQQSVDQDVDSYLGDAGIPTRPHGFRWFVRLPSRLAAGLFFDRVTARLALTAPTARYPHEVASAMLVVVEQMYNDPVL